jgi:hypothetical protein
MDKERRKQAVQNGQAAADDFKPSDLGPTCLIVCPASVMENWARELETVSQAACLSKHSTDRSWSLLPSGVTLTSGCTVATRSSRS